MGLCVSFCITLKIEGDFECYASWAVNAINVRVRLLRVSCLIPS